jgi:hypothetical protein
MIKIGYETYEADKEGRKKVKEEKKNRGNNSS